MRSLAVKLTLAFLIVGLTGAVLVAILVRQSTRSAFDQFIMDREQQSLIATLTEYYQTNGKWDGVADYLRIAIQEPDQEPPQGALQGRPDDQAPFPDNRKDYHRSWNLFTLIGPDYTILFSGQTSRIGQTVPNTDVSHAISLTVDGKTIGWLTLAPPPKQWILSNPEKNFLERVNKATAVSAVFASVLALFLGGLLAYTLTRSMRELREATDDIARGNLGRQVKIRSKDELGDLADSFNKMSTDLARATQARRQMTADIAHDLRTPLSVISGYTEALSDGKLPGNTEIYGVLYQETLYLKRLIDDLRELSLADAGELTLNLQSIQLHSLLEQAATRHAVAAKNIDVTLRVNSSPELPLIKADPERISQVLDNLIINALRYTPAGEEIVLTSDVVNHQVRIKIQDSGCGIAPEDLPNIFNRFYRGDKSRQQNGESGLGLAISKSIVEAHHGTISVDSEQGKGTTFSILFPYA